MDIAQQLQQIALERDVPLEELLHDLGEALAVAYKKYVGAESRGTGRDDGLITIHLAEKGVTAEVNKEVVGIVTDHNFQIAIETARLRRPDVEIGDMVPMPIDPNVFGRIAAQTFKQVLNQKLREAESRHVHDVFSSRIGELVSGTVTRREGSSVYVLVNKVEAELPKREQVPTEPYRINDHVKVYVLKVDEQGKRLRVVVSRTHPNLLRKLFELEIPEIAQGIVLLRGIAREPGQRSKVAVISTDERVDAVGSCVGQRGSRVQAIVDELYDEKIDIVPYSDDPRAYITNALSPAKVNKLTLNEEEHSALAIVPDTQLSLAIGKGGQNVRLAARLTEWKIDIRSEGQSGEPRGR
ncbi:MAG: transcription termination/antitermination protein NusA [Fimbriimonadaceae bacterium]|nr:transcription termination/antitermination protein NusA [Fimbriimonadaceae bacterium]